MPNSVKFPSSVEIKRAIAAAEKAGVQIGSIEIEPRKITIHPLNQSSAKMSPDEEYARWKAANQLRKSHFK